MIPRSARLGLSLTIAMLAAPGLAAADDATTGETLAYTCHGCHGIPNYKNAFPVYSVPKIGGQHAEYLVVALKEYASQERPHATMHAHAATMSAEDMQAVAKYLAGAPAAAGTPRRAVGTAPKASQTCVACHGSDGIGILPEYPNIAGQHPDYIAHSLKAYKSGQRKNAVMAGMAAALTDEDIEALAEYYGQQPSSLCSTQDIRKFGECRKP